MKVYNDKRATFKVDDYSIDYSLRSARKDCNHLVVVFNGYRHGGWDFSKPIDFVKCHILFIEDIFKGQQSCYLGINGSLEFSDGVNQLIVKTLSDLSLTKMDCTFLGASKGGFAALFIGLKFNYKNIVAASFVGHIGKWMKDYNVDISKHVMGNYNEEIIGRYDNLLVDSIAKDKHLDKNIYLFISEKDHFYLQYGQKEVIQELCKYNNANLFFTTSELAFQHDQVAAYYLQEILSVLGLMIQGVPVSLTKQRLNDNNRIGMLCSPKQSEIDNFNNVGVFEEKAFNSINKLLVEDHKLFIEGLGFIHNYDSPSHSFLSKKLCLYNSNFGKKFEYELGAVPQKEQTRQFFSGKYVNYTASGLATMGHKGIDLKSLPEGEYLISISITKSVSVTSYQKINLEYVIDTKFLSDNFEYRIYQKNNQIYLLKQSVCGQLVGQASYFQLDEVPSIIDDHLFIQGQYAVVGADISQFHLCKYYCLLTNKETGRIVVVPLGQMRGKGISKHFGQSHSGYEACFFATMNFEGIALSDLDVGAYNISISLSYLSNIFNHPLNFDVVVDETGVLFKEKTFILKEIVG